MAVASEVTRAFVIEVAIRSIPARVGHGRSEQPDTEREVRVQSGPLSRSGRVRSTRPTAIARTVGLGPGLRSSRLPASSGTSSESSRGPTDCSSGATTWPITRGAASAALSVLGRPGRRLRARRDGLSRGQPGISPTEHIFVGSKTVVRDHGRLAPNRSGTQDCAWAADRSSEFPLGIDRSPRRRARGPARRAAIVVIVLLRARSGSGE